MHIAGVNLDARVRAVRAAKVERKAKRQRKRTGTDDSVDISEDAVLAGAREAETESARAERIARIRQEIRDGTYDTEEKFRIAINRMIDSILS